MPVFGDFIFDTQTIDREGVIKATWANKYILNASSIIDIFGDELLLQFRIGSGGGGGGVAFRGGGPGAILSRVTEPSNFIYLAAIAVFLIICIVLIVLVIRELNLQKKKK